MMEVLERAGNTQACNRETPPTQGNEVYQSVTPLANTQTAATTTQRHWRRTTRGTGTNGEGEPDRVRPGRSPRATPREHSWIERGAASYDHTQDDRQDLAPPSTQKDIPTKQQATRNTHTTAKSRTKAEQTSTTANCCLPWSALWTHYTQVARRGRRSAFSSAHRQPSTFGYRATRVGEAKTQDQRRGETPSTPIQTWTVRSWATWTRKHK